MTGTDFTTTSQLVSTGQIDATEEYGIYPPPSQPMAVARRIIDDCYTTAATRQRLITYRDKKLYFFTGSQWQANEDELADRRPLYDRLELVTYMTDNGAKPWAPTGSKISNVLEPLKLLAMDNQPAELQHLTPLANGLLDPRTRELHPHTPDKFYTWHLPFEYDKTAQCPNWNAFLTSVFAHDPKAPLTLQEYAGYLISGATNQHKALLLVGVPRAGKGITSTVLQALMGEDNTATTSLHDLAGDFGLSALVGKPLTVIEDARGSNRGDKLATERLLNIIANDTVSINRKGIDYITRRLDTRLLLVSNEVPRLTDASAAIMNRFITIRFTRSFTEAEQDKQLGGKLLAELPGIFNWALDGLDRLRKQGQFTIPDSMADVTDAMADLASPIAQFLEEQELFEITGNPADWIDATKVNKEYRRWCALEGRQTMNRESLASAITAAAPGVTFKNTRVSDTGEWGMPHPKRRIYVGVKPINEFMPVVYTSSENSA